MLQIVHGPRMQTVAPAVTAQAGTLVQLGSAVTAGQSFTALASFVQRQSTIRNASPQHIEQALYSFLTWARSSLDVVRSELLECAFALLLLCYSELLLRDESDKRTASDRTACVVARGLLESARRNVPEWSAGYSPYHADILAALCTLPDSSKLVFGKTEADRLQSLRTGHTAAGEVLYRLLEYRVSGKEDPHKTAPRYRVALSATALNLLLDYFTRTGAASEQAEAALAIQLRATALSLDPFAAGLLSSTTALQVPNMLLSLLNEGVHVVRKDIQSASEPLLSLGLPLPITDVAAGLAKAASAAHGQGQAAGPSLKWGVPHAAADAYLGSLKRESVPYPDFTTALGRALLSSASVVPPSSTLSTGTAAGKAGSTTTSAGSGTGPLIRTARLEDTASGIRCVAASARPHVSSSSGQALPAGVSITRAVACGRGDGSVHVWATLTFELAPTGAASSSTGGGAAANASGPSATTVTTTVSFQSAQDTGAGDYISPPTAMAVSHCCGFVLSGHADGTIRLWQVSRYANAAVVQLAQEMKSAGFALAMNTTTAASSTGRPLPPSAPAPSAYHSSALVHTMVPLAVYGQGSGHNSMPVLSLAFNPLAASLWASAGRDGAAYIWSSASTLPQRVCAGHAGGVPAVAWHPNGLYIFTGSQDGSARCWDAASGDALVVYSRGVGSARVSVVAPSPSGRFVAVGDDMGSVHVWDVPSGLPVADLKGLPARLDGNGKRLGTPVDTLCWSDSGDMLLGSAQAVSEHSSGSAGQGRPAQQSRTYAHMAVWDVTKAIDESVLTQSHAGRKRGAADSKAESVSPLAGLVSVLRFPGQQLHAVTSEYSAEKSFLCVTISL